MGSGFRPRPSHDPLPTLPRLSQVELRFPSALYVSGFELYEIWAFGSLNRIATPPDGYLDDNTVHCEGDTCSQETPWNTIWQGAASMVDPVDGEGRIFSPPVCPMAYPAEIVRLEFDTAASPGWNALDAARLIGTTNVASGLVLAIPGAESPNRVTYEPWVGVHGNDSLAYTGIWCHHPTNSPTRRPADQPTHQPTNQPTHSCTATDCYAWSDEVAEVRVVIEEPSVDFTPAYSYHVMWRARDEVFTLSVDLTDVMAVLSSMVVDGATGGDVQAELRAAANLSLASARVGDTFALSLTDASAVSEG